MATIDIREKPEKIEVIIFGNKAQLTPYDDESITICDYHDCESAILFDDIDNLIKALKKAKELWLNEGIKNV